MLGARAKTFVKQSRTKTRVSSKDILVNLLLSFSLCFKLFSIREIIISRVIYVASWMHFLLM
jgi:hypothetical protein